MGPVRFDLGSAHLPTDAGDPLRADDAIVRAEAGDIAHFGVVDRSHSLRGV
jgi:hypothetical protein